MIDTKNKKLTVLDSVIKIFETLEGSKLSEESMNKISQELTVVQDYIGCSQIQACLFALIFALQNKSGDSVTFQMLADYLDESFLYIIKYKKDLNFLLRENLIDTARGGFDNSEKIAYVVNKMVSDCLVEDRPLNRSNCVKDTQEILYDITELIWEHVRNDISNNEYIFRLNDLESRYEKNEVIKNVNNKYPDDIDTRVFIYSLCLRVVNGSDYQDSDEDPSGFDYRIFSAKNLNKFKNKIIDGTYEPIKDGYVGKKFINVDGGFVRRRLGVCPVFSLTQKGLDLFFGSEKGEYEAEDSSTSEFDFLRQFLLEFAANYENHQKSVGMKRSLLRNVERRHNNLEFVKTANTLITDRLSRYIFYDCCNDFVALNGCSYLTSTLQDIYGDDEEYFKKVHEFKDEKNFLQTEGFLILEKNENINKSTLTLSDRTFELIYGKNADLYVNNIYDNNIIDSEKLKDKTLFYPENVEKQVCMLKKSLENSNLLAMQKRLGEKALPKGIAVLLYGAAGTGKTESVYQIAKATKRKIYHVDISETKSMWFGESEKLIKKVFTNYKNLCKTCERHHENTPILLFNEADAIISKRKSVDSGNVAQTENAIQNIILEQMENLDGIMIATTNLCENMDKAFERRFLFKIKFDKPGLKERTLIWKDKLSILNDKEAEEIARKYDFTGGEIDNIVRKCEIDEVITGEIPNLSKIEDLCKHERLATQENHTMGFTL
ncbi:MAG: ATP-binding protein [Treponema sp.]|nr:ATP-binding protein [Treponema sp.]